MVIARAVNWCGRGGFAPAARESEQWWRGLPPGGSHVHDRG
jgi:hypothetical protein